MKHVVYPLSAYHLSSTLTDQSKKVPVVPGPEFRRVAASETQHEVSRLVRGL